MTHPTAAAVPIPPVPGTVAAVVLALSLAACAGASPAVPAAPTPAEIPRLEAALALDPGALAVRLRLAEAQRRNGQPEAARLLLEPAAAEPAAVFSLALLQEDLGDLAAARRLYREYLERGQNGELLARVRDRLALLERLELQRAVRDALTREQELAGTPPAPRTVGVFPFLMVTDDPSLQPLGTALAEMLTTALAQTDRLTVLERSQVRLLLDEIRLGESGRVDAATAARSGRILGAGSLVQGRIEGDAGQIALQAAVLSLPQDSVGRNPLRDRDALERIFDLEKRLALAVFQELGIQLTEAERQRVTRMATRNVQALIAFGYGLEAMDAGRHAEAATRFVEALHQDPGFDAARSRYEEAVALYRAEGSGPGQLGALGALELGPLEEVRRWQRAFERVELLVPDPATRDAAAEALGVEGPGRQGTAEIIIRRPGGGT
jgi:tetratricopeptide (TPR) repeat protein